MAHRISAPRKLGRYLAPHADWQRQLANWEVFDYPTLRGNAAILGGAFSIFSPLGGVRGGVRAADSRGYPIWRDQTRDLGCAYLLNTNGGRVRDYMDNRALGPDDSTIGFFPELSRWSFGEDRMRALRQAYRKELVGDIRPRGGVGVVLVGKRVSPPGYIDNLGWPYGQFDRVWRTHNENGAQSDQGPNFGAEILECSTLVRRFPQLWQPAQRSREIVYERM